MRILHTEASPGWGGQEIRILRESEGMRSRGHEVVLAVNAHGGLVEPARKAGFRVFELSFKRKDLLWTLLRLVRLIRKHKVDVVNTHSSLDAWVAGIAARICRKKVVRTRHLSTAIRTGLNSIFLYNFLADQVVTTCEAVVETIRSQARLPKERCLSIPTGINPKQALLQGLDGGKFRKEWGIGSDVFLVGTVCVLRSWKGVSDLLHAAKILKGKKSLKWLVVGGGVSEQYFRTMWKDLDLEKQVIFTGHLENPFPALDAMDAFTLLSSANEGVSQASLQAAYLEKPLVTTKVGGLPEVCLQGKTGFQVGTSSPQEVADCVLQLMSDRQRAAEMGRSAKQLVLERFTMEKTLDEMESVFAKGLDTSCA